MEKCLDKARKPNLGQRIQIFHVSSNSKKEGMPIAFYMSGLI